MKKRLLYLLYSLLFFIPTQLLAQTPVTLGTSPYTETFDGIASGYPSGFAVNLSSTSSSIGTAATTTIFTVGSTTLWNATGNGIKNYASADALPSSATSTDQGAATNRALGVRQTSATGYDPGTAFVFQVANTTGKKNFKLTFQLQSLDPSSARTTTWLVDYGLGASPTTFTPVTATGTLTTGASAFSNNTVSVDFGSLLDNQSGVVTIRIVTLTASGTSGNRASTAIDDYSLSWTNIATPTLAATPTSLDFGTSQTVNTTSTAKTFSLSGANLTAGATLTTAAPYSVSSDGVTYGTSASFTAAQLASAQTVYVKFSPTTTTASPGSVSIASTGATTQNVTLTGTGAAAVVPSLTATPATLAFGNQQVGSATVLPYTLSGANLGTGSATVTASASYQVSKSSATGYATSISFTATEIAASPTVYVQFSPTATGSTPGTITITDPDVTTGPTVTLTGTGVVPVLAVTPSTIAFGNQTITTTSSAQTFSLTGTFTTAATTVTTAAPYSVSKDGTTYSTSISYSTAELASAQTVYVKFSPTALATSTGNAICATSGGTSQTVTLTGTGVAIPVPALTAAPTSLTFSATVGTTSVQTYTLAGVNLSGATTVTTTAPYTVSKDGITYSTSLSYSTTELATTQTVYVKFSPTAVGAASGSITNATPGGTTQTITLNGTGIGVPVLTVTPTTLTFSQVINTTSTQTYTLSGVYLTANTTLTATGAYTISKDGSTYGTSLTYTTAELATAQTVYVKFSPTAIGAANGTVVQASTGAVSQTVTLNGTGLGVPALTVTPATLTFTQQSGSASTAQTYALSGAYLTASTTVTTAAPYTISKDGVTYGTSLTYTTAELASTQTVYVKFTPTAIGTANGSITITSAGATSQTVTLNGTGINAPPTLAAIADQSVCYINTQQVIPLTGITAVEAGQAVTSITVTSDNPALFASLGVLPLNGTTSQINYTLANNAVGSANVTVTVKDNGGTANNGLDTYTRTFKLTVNALAVVTITSDAPGNVVFKGSTAQLTATGGTTYNWTASTDIISGTGNATVTIRPKASATYTVTATNASGCTTVQTITIAVSNASKLETSNIITPNGDGINDTWIVRNIDLYPGNNVKVYDKTGKLVFSKTGYVNDWNGYFNGQPLTQGTYYYVVDLGNGLPYSGYISVIRD